ncbi:MAG TPA: mannitol dehydrogenase family protein [Steroidobacteraceae bacterium]|nr:mannitol dehydrogenase family protein [Steroidobacteraceae bacterium]
MNTASALPRLSEDAIERLPPAVRRPSYELAQRRGIVHLGVGAFHRAHQAVYTDDAMAAGARDWGITGVSLRGTQVRDQLQPQDGLYTVTQSGNAGQQIRLIGAVRQMLVAPEDPHAVIEALAAADTRIVSLTLTEKGYHRQPDLSLDWAAAPVALDLQGGAHSLYGLLARACALRRRRGLPGVTLLSCDNLADNGPQLERLLLQFLERLDPATAAWVRRECSCPATMVDRIVPATTVADLEHLDRQLGVHDAAAVMTEPFRQWVIEDRFAGPRPPWEVGGAQWVSQVGPYETAKLRMLNGAHSALAYIGLARGHELVAQAIADPSLAVLINVLMRAEAARSFTPAPQQDLETYADLLLARFANVARPHRLRQIAMDGSQKIPQRWLDTLRSAQSQGRRCDALLQALGAWIAYVRGDRFTVEDPAAPELAQLWREQGVSGIAGALFGPGGRFPQWTASAAELATLTMNVQAYLAH